MAQKSVYSPFLIYNILISLPLQDTPFCSRLKFFYLELCYTIVRYRWKIVPEIIIGGYYDLSKNLFSYRPVRYRS